MTRVPFDRRTIVLGAFALIASVIILKSIAAAPSATAPSTGKGDASAAPQLGRLMADIPQLQEAPTPNPDATWTSVIRLEGSDRAQSDPFDLSGKAVRIRYAINPDADAEVSLLIASVLPAGGTSGTGLVLPDVIAAGPRESETFIGRPPGRYYLNVESFSGAWTIEVAEEQ